MPSLPSVVTAGRRLVVAGASDAPNDVAAAKTFELAVAALERSLTGPQRLALAADFSPSADYARRFLNTIALYRAQPQTRALARRALKAVTALWAGPSPVGRTPGSPVDAARRGEVAATIAFWTVVVGGAWEDRASVQGRVYEASQGRFTWAVTYDRALRAVLRRPKVRPREVVLTLVGWELGLSARQVRQATRPPGTRDVRYA